MRLCLAGDVMPARGIDQILPSPGDPTLYEDFLRSAEDYVTLAERRSGPIPRRAPPTYVWGDVLDLLADRRPDLRIVNLEAAITTASIPAPKDIHYRLHPANVGVLAAAGIDACALANNHVMDWGEEGLLETLSSLDRAGIGHTGAGLDAAAAAAPWVGSTASGGRLLLLSYGSPGSGVPTSWRAGPTRPGVALMDGADTLLEAVRARLDPLRRPGDVVVISLHWGDNWTEEVGSADRRLAHRLIEEAGVDVVHGHSSHPARGIEVHRGRPILYGCGDLLNDYEGISAQEELRGDLVLLYLLDLEPRGLAALELVPLRLCRFRLGRASPEDTARLAARMRRLCGALGTGVRTTAEGTLALTWT